MGGGGGGSEYSFVILQGVIMVQCSRECTLDM